MIDPELLEYCTEAGKPLKCPVCESKRKSVSKARINDVEILTYTCECSQVVGRSTAGEYDPDFFVWAAERLGMREETL